MGANQCRDVDNTETVLPRRQENNTQGNETATPRIPNNRSAATYAPPLIRPFVRGEFRSLRFPQMQSGNTSAETAGLSAFCKKFSCDVFLNSILLRLVSPARLPSGKWNRTRVPKSRFQISPTSRQRPRLFRHHDPERIPSMSRFILLTFTASVLALASGCCGGPCGGGRPLASYNYNPAYPTAYAPTYSTAYNYGGQAGCNSCAAGGNSF